MPEGPTQRDLFFFFHYFELLFLYNFIVVYDLFHLVAKCNLFTFILMGAMCYVENMPKASTYCPRIVCSLADLTVLKVPNLQ